MRYFIEVIFEEKDGSSSKIKRDKERLSKIELYVSDNPTDKDCFSRFRREICSSRFRRALYVYVIVEFCVLYKTKKK